MKRIRVSRRALGCLLLSAIAAFGQTQATPGPKKTDRAAAYYHYAMAHLYEQIAREHRSMDHVNKAIEEYKLAIQADPSSEYLTSELVDLYLMAGRLNDAVAEAETILKRDPNNIQIRRMLGRIYRGYLADPAQSRANEDLVRRAIEQYEKIIELDPKDAEAHRSLAILHRVARDSVKAEQALKKALEIDPDSEDALTELAALYGEIGDTAGAIDMLSRASRKRPNAKVLAALGGAYEQAGQGDKAIEVLEKAIQLDRQNLEARRSLARNLLLAERWDRALDQYQTLANSDPQDPQNFLRLAQVYRQKRDFAQARANLQKAAALAPAEMVEVPYNEALLLESEGKPDQAVAAMQKLIDSTAKSKGSDYTPRERANRAFFFEKLGMIERSREAYQEAEKAFRNMAEADPDSAARASVQLVETFRASRDYRRALQESDAAAKKHPADRSVSVIRASVLADNGDARQGADLLRGLLKSSAEDRELLLAMAQVLEKGKFYPEAREAVEKARGYAQTKEQKRAVYFTFGSLLERQKQYDEAEKQFRLVLDLDPQDGGALNYLGYMLADRNVRLEEAFQLIQKAVELEPDNGAYLDSLGWVYYRQNKLEQAEQFLQRALGKASRDPTVHDHLGDVYYKQGKIRLAHEQWQRSLREWEQSSKSENNPDEIAKIRRKVDGVKVRLAQEQAAPKRSR